MASPLQTGAIIGEYELVRLLGRGGMGDVWLAMERMTDRKVAMKFIKPHLLEEGEFLKRFLIEAKTLARLEHDRIVRLHRVLQTDEYLALILGFIEGRSLADVIQDMAPLPSPFVLACARDVLPALGVAHQRGIVHRDIKPQNILIDLEGRAFVSDFGIAVAEFAGRGTATGVSIGTPHYMSPEQIANPEKLNPQEGGHRSDIYSFGVVLFEMLTGKLPFGQQGKFDDLYRVQTMHCTMQPPRLTSFVPSVPAPVEAVVLMCLEKDPANRPQSCKQLLEMLEKAVAGVAPAPVREHTGTVLETIPSELRPPPIPQPGAGGGTVPVRQHSTGQPGAAASAGQSSKGKSNLIWMGAGAIVVAAGVSYAIFTQSKPDNKPSEPTPVAETKAAPKPAGTPTQRASLLPNPGPGTPVSTPGGGGATQPVSNPPQGGGMPAGQPTSSMPVGANAGLVANEAQQLMSERRACDAQPRAARAAELDPRYQRLFENSVQECTKEKMAQADASSAGSLFTSGDYCGAQTKMTLAANRYPRPEYSQKLTDYKTACENALR